LSKDLRHNFRSQHDFNITTDTSTHRREIHTRGWRANGFQKKRKKEGESEVERKEGRRESFEVNYKN